MSFDCCLLLCTRQRGLPDAVLPDLGFKVGQEIVLDKNFREMPVLHEGRVKTIDSFARFQLKTLSVKNMLMTLTRLNGSRRFYLILRRQQNVKSF